MRRSYKIALAAVSSAIAVIAVVAQAYVSTVSIAVCVIAALAISLPLTQKSIGGAIFSYVAAGLIGFFAVNIKALPFIMFYAPYAIIAYALDFVFYPSEKVKLPKWAKIVVITVLKLGFFGAAFYGCLTLMKVVVTDIALFGVKWTMPLLMVAGFIAFCVYDPLYRFVFINMSKIVNKYVGGNRRNSGRSNDEKPAPTASVEPLEGDVFDGYGDGSGDVNGENNGDGSGADNGCDKGADKGEKVGKAESGENKADGGESVAGIRENGESYANGAPVKTDKKPSSRKKKTGTGIEENKN